MTLPTRVSPGSCLQLALVLLLLVVVSGCSRTQPQPTRLVRVAALDGQVEYPVSPGGDVYDAGWWLGARDRYVSPNSGVIVANALAEQFNRIPGVEVYSREDLEIYMAQKERVLKREYPELDSWQRKRLLTMMDPLLYGRSLNVDYVLTNSVAESKLITNRTFSWWYSRLEVTVQLWDVPSGTMVREWKWQDADNFDSPLALAEECARELAREARREDLFQVLGPQ